MKNHMEKLIVALEGIDGSGKSTVIAALKKIYDIAVYKRTEKSAFIDQIVSSKLMSRYYMLQVPIYIALSHRNKRKFKTNGENIIFMDRCFLSNICYFFPKALEKEKLLNILMIFEPKFFPHKIFVLDVEPHISQKRDRYKKELYWLEQSRNGYLNSACSKLLRKYDIEILDAEMRLSEKVDIISRYISEYIKGSANSDS